jgi:hypothetical protein
MSRLVLPLVLLAAFASVGAACPFCDGGPSGRNAVREAIFGERFWPIALGTALPFAVFFAIAALIHFGLPFGRREKRQ